MSFRDWTPDKAREHNARVAAEAAKARTNPRPVRKLNEERTKNVAQSNEDALGMAAASKASIVACNAFPPKEKALKKARVMNKTEKRYSLVLEVMKQAGEILDWRYEGVRLKWGGEMHYTGDFVVSRPAGKPPLIIEVKGNHVYSRDIVRFKGCREEWKNMFAFEMWKYSKGTWNRMH